MKKFYRIFFILIAAFGFNQAGAQNTSLNCTRDTTVSCSTQCFTLIHKVPDAKGSSNDYVVNKLAGQGVGCFNQIINPQVPGSSTNISADDRYSQVIDLPFTFSFYGIDFSQIVISGNGIISFDITLANQFSHYGILSTNGTTLSATTGTGVDLPSDLYDRALIMGPYHDINPTTTTSPTRRLKYDVYGTAPNRVFVASWYKIPLFNCTSLYQNTHQIALYEGSGIIEVYIQDKQICTTWNDGHAMVGLQDYNRTKSIIAPGRAATDDPWGSIGMNEKWRFIPTEGASLFRSAELVNAAGTVISTGTATPGPNNTLELSFPNVCPTTSVQYFVRTTYAQFNDPNQTVTYVDTVNVIRDALLSATTNIVTADCSNNYVGSATINVTSGTGPFEYSIDGGTTWQSSNVFNLPPGTYTISYRIVGAECSSSKTVVIPAAPGLPAATYDLTQVKCNGLATGAIAVSLAGGNTGFQFSNDNGATFQASGTFSDLAAGSYIISIKDNGGCRKDTTIIITQPDLIVPTPTIVNANCQSLGSISIAATGGVPGYTYSIDNGATFQASNVFNMIGGNYNFIVKDANGCTVPLSNVRIGVDNNLELSTIPDTSICAGNSITLLTSGNADSYSWSPSAGLSDPNIQSPVATPAVGTTTYTVTATLGTCSKSASVRVTSTDLTVNTLPSATVCTGGSVTLTTTGNATSYSWSPAAGLDNPNAQSPVATPAATTTYTVTASLGTCSTTKTVTVTVSGSVNVSTIGNSSICAGGSIPLTTTGTATSYSWSPATGLNNPNIQSPVASPAATTTYTVTASSGTCVSTASVTITVASGLTVNAGPDLTITAGESVRINATAPGATIFNWTPATGLSSATILNPVASPLETTRYTLTASDASGCSGSDNVLITVNPVEVSDCINVRNAFSPNGDGINEQWIVYDDYSCLKNVTVHVFNRYGSKVFESKDYRNTWDGKYKNEPVPDGTYYAVIDFTLITGKKITKKIDVTIVR